MGGKVAVLQSNYLPWRGYFDLIHDVDLFIFYDEVQYTKNDWRNRNRVYSAQGLSWLTLPCGYDIHQSISEVRLKNELCWAQKHWNIIKNAYGKALYFGEYCTFFEEVYFGRSWERLSELNQYLIRSIARDFLGIKTQFAQSTAYPSRGRRGEKLLSLLQAAGCKTYVSGPAAQSYIDPADFERAGIELVWKEYPEYPEYPQMRQSFEPGVSIIDLLFNMGPHAPEYIWDDKAD